jgi:hypothetical protein
MNSRSGGMSLVETDVECLVQVIASHGGCRVISVTYSRAPWGLPCLVTLAYICEDRTHSVPDGVHGPQLFWVKAFVLRIRDSCLEDLVDSIATALNVPCRCLSVARGERVQSKEYQSILRRAFRDVVPVSGHRLQQNRGADKILRRFRWAGLL